MRQVLFIFLALFLLLLSVFSGGIKLPIDTQFQLSLFFLLVLGVPHGAIDNIIFIAEKKVSAVKFYSIYLGIIAFNIILWFFLPVLAILLFLLTSAYHFGQSQITHYIKTESIQSRALYCFWGIAILSGLITFNADEIALLVQANPDLEVFYQADLTYWTNLICWISLTIFVLIWTIALFQKKIRIKVFALEIIVLALILFSFYLFPLLIGFTLYFAVLHSYKVLREEYDYMKSKAFVKRFIDFLKAVFPYTALSMFGMLAFIALIEFEVIDMSYGYILLILVSSITLPHAFVMDEFYKALYGNGLSKR